MTRFIIRGVPTRAAMIAYCREKMPYAEWCMDKTSNAMDTFLAAMRQAGDDPAVHLEEDIIVCENLREKVEAVIAERPDTLIQFFSMRKADLTVGSRWDSNFMMNQCFYLPATFSNRIADFWQEWPRKKSEPWGYDTMMNDWLKANKLRYWIHVPSLVDHRIARSAIDKRRSSKRQSKTFKEFD